MGPPYWPIIFSIKYTKGSKIHSKKSAHDFFNEQFDFNATPLDPPGTRVIINSKPTNHASWDPNGKVGLYIGPYLNHYQCVKICIYTTRAEVNADTVVFPPQKIDFDDFLMQAS